MPRLAANLGWLFAERPFLERFGAAAAAGFAAVELLSPYGHAPAAVRAELERFGLISMLGSTLRSGAKASSDWRRCRAASANGGRLSPAHSITRPPSARVRSIASPAGPTGKAAGGGDGFRRQSRGRGGGGRQNRYVSCSSRSTCATVPTISSAVSSRRPTSCARSVRRTCASSSISITCRSCRRRSHPPLRAASAADRPCADRRRAERREPDEGEVNYPAILAALDRARLCGLCRLRISSARTHRGRARLGAALRSGAAW